MIVAKLNHCLPWYSLKAYFLIFFSALCAHKKIIGEFLNSNFIREDSEAQIKFILYGHKTDGGGI